jgi:hypothetical protein
MMLPTWPKRILSGLAQEYAKMPTKRASPTPFREAGKPVLGAKELLRFFRIRQLLEE